MTELSAPADAPHGTVTYMARAATPWLRFRIEYALFRVIAKIAAILPLETCSAWSGWCWRQAGRFSSRGGRALTQLAQSLPELSEKQRKAIIVEMWDNLGRVFAEGFHLRRIMDDPARYRILREAELRELVGQRKGFVYVSLHSGNWELCVLGPMRAGLRLAGLYRAVNNPFVDAYVRKIRQPLYAAGLLPKSRETARRCMKLMRAGSTIAMLADLREVSGVPVPFLGRPAPSSRFPALLSIAHDVPILAGRVLRRAGARFEFDWRLIEPARGGSRDENIGATTALIQSCLEAWVRERPGEWMWVQRRWG
jgi:KDO2-lipid IV(A) lauroyltransferase